MSDEARYFPNYVTHQNKQDTRAEFNATGTVLVDPVSRLTLPTEYVYHKYSNASFNGTVGNGVNVLLDTFVIPAGFVGPTGRIECEVAYSFGPAANAKDPLVRIGHGSAGWATGSVNFLNNQGLTSQNGYRVIPTLVNKGSVNQNRLYPPQSAGLGHTGESDYVDSAVDFSQEVTIYFGGSMLNGLLDPLDVVRLEWYTVRILR